MKKLSKITESLWSEIQDRSAGKDIRKEDLILDNEELQNKIHELYKKQGEGDTLDVSSLTNLIRCNDFSNIFLGLDNVEHIIGLENWDVSKVTNMEEMFNGCEKFNADLSKWDVSSVEDMNSMFNGCKKFNSDLSNWNVSGVENMACMFSYCESFNADLSKWDVSNVVDMGSMFTGCKKFNSDLSKWDVSNVVDMGAMFNDCVNFNADLSKWNVSNAEHMGAMFSYCENFNADLSNWNISKVTSMGCMFTECKKFNSDLSKWDVSNVVDMSAMFKDCINFNADLSKWDVSKVTNMKEMFNGCKKFNSDLSNWNVSNVKDGEDMFNDCYSLKLIPSWHIRKFINIKESLWSEIQDRSSGEILRKEDEIGNIKELKSVDMGGTVFWADKDLCCSDEYHFGYSEVFEYIKKSEWRLPTLKEVEELDEYKVKTYDNSFVISGPSEDLIFIARGLVYSDKVKEITDDDFYFAWTSDLCNNHQVHILTFDDDKLIHSKIDSNNIMDQITNDISGKLCVRLVKDK